MGLLLHGFLLFKFLHEAVYVFHPHSCASPPDRHQDPKEPRLGGAGVQLILLRIQLPPRRGWRGFFSFLNLLMILMALLPSSERPGILNLDLETPPFGLVLAAHLLVAGV